MTAQTPEDARASEEKSHREFLSKLNLMTPEQQAASPNFEPVPAHDELWTPTTQQVKNAYVVGMRQAFIASAGEHRQEFDRWLSALLATARADGAREALTDAGEMLDEAEWHTAAKEVRALRAAVPLTERNNE